MTEFEISDILRSLKSGRIRISEHSDDECQNDKLTFDEVFWSVTNGEIIERYPDDTPYPSCLILGKNFKDEPIHSVWAYNRKSEASILITVYRPDPKKWIDWKQRRK